MLKMIKALSGLGLFMMLSVSLSAAELQEVADSSADNYKVQTGFNLPADAKLYIEPMLVEFKEGWQKTYNQHSRSTANRVNDRDMQTLQERSNKRFNRALSDAFKSHDYTLVDSANDADYIIKAKLMEYDINGPDLRKGANKRLFVRFAGSGKLWIQLSKANGEVVAEMSDYQRAYEHPQLQESSRMFHDYEARRMVRRWVKQFLTEITSE